MRLRAGADQVEGLLEIREGARRAANASPTASGQRAATLDLLVGRVADQVEPDQSPPPAVPRDRGGRRSSSIPRHRVAAGMQTGNFPDDQTGDGAQEGQAPPPAPLTASWETAPWRAARPGAEAARCGLPRPRPRTLTCFPPGQVRVRSVRPTYGSTPSSRSLHS